MKALKKNEAVLVVIFVVVVVVVVSKANHIDVFVIVLICNASLMKFWNLFLMLSVYLNGNGNCSFKVVFVRTERMASFTQTKNFRNFFF